MFARKLVISAMIAAATIGAIATPIAGVGATVYMEQAPPPLREERMPAPRHGYVWSPGHWTWVNHHHVWRNGYWVRERHGYVYRPDHWVERGGRWYFEPGHWER